MHVDIHSVKLADADRNIPVTGCLCPFAARENVYLENRNHTLEIPPASFQADERSGPRRWDYYSGIA